MGREGTGRHAAGCWQERGGEGKGGEARWHGGGGGVAGEGRGVEGSRCGKQSDPLRSTYRKLGSIAREGGRGGGVSCCCDFRIASFYFSYQLEWYRVSNIGGETVSGERKKSDGGLRRKQGLKKIGLGRKRRKSDWGFRGFCVWELILY